MWAEDWKTATQGKHKKRYHQHWPNLPKTSYNVDGKIERGRRKYSSRCRNSLYGGLTYITILGTNPKNKL